MSGMSTDPHPAAAAARVLPAAAVPFVKGHGTENDFVLVIDREGTRPLDQRTAAALADRHSGIGGDGVIRVVPTALADDDAVRALADRAAWFMDYRNADGGLSEMCGNGARVFAAYLRGAGLEAAAVFAIATRAGIKVVTVDDRDDDVYSVDLGQWRLTDPATAGERGFDALVKVPGVPPLSGLSVEVGNPHTVVALPPGVELEGLDLTRAPMVDPLPAEGSNVEFVELVAAGHIRMRVFERGVGETRSCGTGAVAAAMATRWWEGVTPDNADWVVDVPGGRLGVRAQPSGSVELSGPAVLVAEGMVTLAAGQ